MKLLISNSRASYYIGGTEVVSLHQAIELARRGHQIVFVTRKVAEYSEYFVEFKDKISAELLPIEIFELVIDASFGDGKSWALWNYEALSFGLAARPLYLESKKNGINLFISHLITDAIFAPLDIPSAVHLHGSPHQTDMLIDSAILFPREYIAHSDSIKEWWMNNYAISTMATFRNGVDTGVVSSSQNKRTTDILYVGRFLEHKGILDILKAAPKDASLVIAGSGPLEGEIREHIEQNGLVNARVFVRPSNEELANLYADAKLFVCPSRGKEGVLTTMLEAAAAGCAIVTSKGSGMTDLASHNNSVLITPGDIPALQSAIKELLTDEDKRNSLSQVMSNEIQANWSWKQKGKELEEIYEAIIRQ